MKKKLLEKTLKELGFKKVWPRGNPTEPWYRNDKLHITFHDGSPTMKEFYNEIIKTFINIGEQKMKHDIRVKIYELYNVLGLDFGSYDKIF